MNTTKRSCKYFETCGSNENCINCKGMEKKKTPEEIKKRLKYLRREIKAERISCGEIAELQSLKKHIEPGDFLLAEWAGIPENIFRRIK